jgi:hypothetical protein
MGKIYLTLPPRAMPDFVEMIIQDPKGPAKCFPKVNLENADSIKAHTFEKNRRNNKHT